MNCPVSDELAIELESQVKDVVSAVVPCFNNIGDRIPDL